MGIIKEVCFVVNRNKIGADELAGKLAQKASALQVKSVMCDDYPLKEGFLSGFDICFVIGGDGSMLGVAQEAVRAQVPVIGINLGKLGFMATLTPDESLNRLPEILQGEFLPRTRAIIHAFTGDGKEIIALNDIVIKSTAGSQLIHLSVFYHKKLVNDFRCDGLIFSTPTGSTAYNLSAGGPIIHPHAKVLAMTPICPHTLTNRSVVFHGETELEVEQTNEPEQLIISADGKTFTETEHPFPIKISLLHETLPILIPQDYSYFNILRTKLHW